MHTAASSTRHVSALGAAVVTLAVLLVVTVTVISRHGSAAGMPVASAAPAVVTESPGPVLLVPGYGGSVRDLESLARRLRLAGRPAQVVTMPGGGTGDLAGQAEVLNSAVRQVISRTGSTSVDIVGYSAGGVVARLWALDDGGRFLARRIVTLGSPHHGTNLAAIAADLAGDQCQLACQQLVPRSSMLNHLNNTGDETPDGPEWISIWSTVDQVVTPPDSARLAGALDLTVQSVCPQSRVAHSELPTDPVVQGLVLGELGPDAPRAYTTDDCRRLGS